jgi:hypothetical protein
VLGRIKGLLKQSSLKRQENYLFDSTVQPGCILRTDG